MLNFAFTLYYEDVKGEKIMCQEKIGRFIATCRKDKNMTQQELAEQLGVTDRAISNWENGKNMPDLSLFKPLCNILGITINELLSGEKLSKENYQEKFEENILDTINYSNKKIAKYSRFVYLLFIIFGLFIVITAITIFPSESSWGSIYSTIGVTLFIIGIGLNFKHLGLLKQSIILIVTVFATLSILLFADYVNVKNNKEAPRFRLTTTTTGDVIYYDTLFYDVYRCHFDEDNEYWTIQQNSNPTIEELINYCK